MFRFSNHELDPRQHELRRGGELVHLEPQVFDLLVFLLQNRDRIVSKDEILDAVWDGRIVSEAALSSRINAARKAVGDTGNEQAVIRTFHKRGFRFIGEAIEEPEGRPTHVPRTQGGATYKSPAVEEATYEANSEPLPEVGKPSIAVLPFVNLSLEPEHEYFAYGLTEDVIRLLGRNRWLTVSRATRRAPQSCKAKMRPRSAQVSVCAISSKAACENPASMSE